ncbi:NADPH-dependent 7-cyano-7-deazaguanine reductase QueF [Paraglaciecola hydrolytica]|uniref:NADPH-dependent 7-cyano-7-deazaguanine reductase n=1 Tax=Paraglaciecola hydrolytica TaxID=1799789 RepID=A0A135ZYV5_9ALTE|nr:NADPH-dependent 7-cyano-7-deazaguanine reductase QueF [Paraglaciecola hydrolytica]KXI28168.1 NADPH-dependent 7-cyano-7-deazaguanine reductase QueF [Paraglaciecola hydrolytica]
MDNQADKARILASLSLGKTTPYTETYSPELLQGVPRSLNRDDLNLADDLPFQGVDRWNGYELSWLNAKGKPQVAILQCEVPASSSNLIESKSFKLYLNSFNQSKFASLTQVQNIISQDLSACAKEPVKVIILSPQEFSSLTLSTLDALSLDELDIEVSEYQLNPEVLFSSDEWVEESLCSDLLKSNCLITNQPDWGSVFIRYQGNKIDHEALLRYLISFRQHNEFHEQCVERIFCDIMRYCSPNLLTVYARYTRRGGLDINPFRSNFESIYPEFRLARQ